MAQELHEHQGLVNVAHAHALGDGVAQALESGGTPPQRQGLQRIANQTKAITIVDREALDDDLLFFKREGGGWARLNRVFGGELDGVLRQLQREAWAA